MVKESYRMFVVRKEVGGYFRFGGPGRSFCRLILQLPSASVSIRARAYTGGGEVKHLNGLCETSRRTTTSSRTLTVRHGAEKFLFHCSRCSSKDFNPPQSCFVTILLPSSNIYETISYKYIHQFIYKLCITIF